MKPEDYVTNELREHVMRVCVGVPGVTPEAMAVNFPPPASLGIPAVMLTRCVRHAMRDLAHAGSLHYVNSHFTVPRA